MGRLFGTDGVRGVANQDLTAQLAFKLGQAGISVLTKDQDRPKVVIGKDTRISGDMLEAALSAGITSVGADVILLGVVPTPAVAYLTRILNADAGIMISASHNSMEDNGIKFFANNGFKLSDEIEDEIESLLDNESLHQPTGDAIGQIYKQENGLKLYMDYLLNIVDLNLQGLHIALDCANGAASEAAPAVLTALGAKVSTINNQPNGTNINHNCGSTYPEVIQEYVKQVGADIGFTHDGDADRVLAVDELGNLIDGDYILAICGLDMISNSRLPHQKIAATVYSNGGLKQAFVASGGDVVFTQAGDRYVLETMVEQGLVLGGEQSGHVIFLEHNTTGDGILTALQLLSVVVAKSQRLSQLAQAMPVFPQVLKNVKVKNKSSWKLNDKIQARITEAEHKLSNGGRIFVRESGTEPLIRIMGEHPDSQLLEEVMDSVVSLFESEL